MGMRFTILGSSSAGNCSLVTTDNCKVLVDCGFSGRRIKQMLAAAGESLEEIDAVFITHEHTDHCAGVRGLLKHSRIQFFANRDTALMVQEKLTKPVPWKLFENGQRFVFKDLEVTPFTVPHDAYDPVGFVFSSGRDDLFSPRKSLAWVTDLGYAPALVREHIRDADLLVVESNHCSEMLESDPHRPWSLKQRISGRHGHLSNAAAFELLSSTERPRWSQVCLAHLSRDCNSVERVRETFAPLHQAGARYGIDIVTPACEERALTYELAAFV